MSTISWLINIRSAYGVLLAVLLAACGGGGDGAGAAADLTPGPVAAVRPGIWVVMGSSSAAGAGAPAGKGWADLVHEGLRPQGSQLANIARGGTTTYHGMPAMSAVPQGRPAPDIANNVDQALSRNPVALLVSYPTNDTALGYSVDETVNNILSIRAAALTRNVPVLVLSTQPRNLPPDQLGRLLAIDQQLGARLGPCLVQIRAALAGANGWLAPAYDAGDGVHPNEEGHRVIADRVKATVNGGMCVKVTN